MQAGRWKGSSVDLMILRKRICDLEEKPIEISHSETQRETKNKTKQNERSITVGRYQKGVP